LVRNARGGKELNGMAGKLHDFLAREAYKAYIRRRRGARRFIRAELGVEGFLRALKERNVSYVVLRWFENLPALPAGEDLDILVADADKAKVEALLDGAPFGGIPCDFYTAGGLPGTDFRTIAYFPAVLANEVLANGVWHNDSVRVPDARHRLLTMAYHVAYHKGYASGLPGAGRPKAPAARDYAAVLRALAADANVEVEPTLEGVDEFLAEQGWRPPLDTLERLSSGNEWILHRFFSGRKIPEHWIGFAMFIVREKGIAMLAEVRDLLRDRGFEILEEKLLNGAEADRIAGQIRGGNWGPGPFPVDAGLPAAALAVYDVHPQPAAAADLAAHPHLDNGRVVDAKARLRELVYSRTHKSQHYTIAHSSDNCAQGLDYLRITMPEREAAIGQRIIALRAAFVTPYPVKKDISGHSQRAKAEIVDFNGRDAVCKTFRPGCERFAAREVEARRIGAGLPEMTPLLDSGPNYVVMPYYRDRLDEACSVLPLFKQGKFMPVPVVRRMAEIVRHFHEQGYEHIDFHPGSLLLDPDEGLRIVDFEFLQRRAGDASPPLAQSWVWTAIPASFTGDRPREHPSVSYYRSYWFGRTGVPLSLLLNGAPDYVLVTVRIATGLAGSGWFFAKKMRRLASLVWRRLRREAGALVDRGAAIEKEGRTRGIL
jgi:hypothetical protein